MKTVFTTLLAVALAACAEPLFAHGFVLSVNVDGNGTPQSLTSYSNQHFLDQDNATSGPSNLFLDSFFIQTGGSHDGGLGTFEGGPQLEGNPLPPWQNATFNILSPLYYSDGTSGAAALATSGTYVRLYDLDVGTYDGATSGIADITGSAATTPGFGISLQDFHEIEKDLYLGSGSTQTYGEYGFAFSVTVPFVNGNGDVISTLTSGPLVDVFATGDTTDSDDPGGFADATDAQQDAATSQIYDSAMAAVPEPSTIALAAACVVIFGFTWLRRRMRRQGEIVPICTLQFEARACRRMAA